jgi:transcriptional regulator with XRE-family HTH domain
MIKNDKQYTVTKSKLNDFKESLRALEQQSMDPLLKELHSDALKSQIEEFEKSINEYEYLKEGTLTYLIAENLPDINEMLVKARIVKGLTQSDLAERLNLKEQQIQRYEISNYSAASMNRINQIANALGLQFGKLKIKVKESPFSIPEGIDEQKLSRIQTERALLIF